MHKHLQTLVLTEVQRGILIHSFRLTAGQVGHGHGKRLLVVLDELRLCRVLTTPYSRRKHVVHRCLVVVLLNVYGTYCQLALLCRRVVEVLIVNSPFATNKVERTESQDDRMLEAGHEHTHETYAGEI